jgi:hypothetical protein
VDAEWLQGQTLHCSIVASTTWLLLATAVRLAHGRPNKPNSPRWLRGSDCLIWLDLVLEIADLL